MLNDNGFVSYGWNVGTAYLDGPIRMNLMSGHDMIGCNNSTNYVYVYDGFLQHVGRMGSIMLQTGMYGCFTDGALRSYEHTKAIVIKHEDVRGMSMVGGPIEDKGRLKYIDGCTDSVLVPPVKLGDPCLNLLHFPAGIRQTQHTHPEVRLGMVVHGSGLCVTPAKDTLLHAGMVFCLPAESEHCFYTIKSEMTVVAWHPVSDVGMTDELHPMVSKTIVNGVSATELPEIRTK